MIIEIMIIETHKQALIDFKKVYTLLQISYIRYHRLSQFI